MFALAVQTRSSLFFFFLVRKKKKLFFAGIVSSGCCMWRKCARRASMMLFGRGDCLETGEDGLIDDRMHSVMYASWERDTSQRALPWASKYLCREWHRLVLHSTHLQGWAKGQTTRACNRVMVRTQCRVLSVPRLEDGCTHGAIVLSSPACYLSIMHCCREGSLVSIEASLLQHLEGRPTDRGTRHSSSSLTEIQTSRGSRLRRPKGRV
jgi:hypothetical protein